jgi:4-amino-4-deoxy-L-arabinose transferase-like glycosyltransferase
VALSASVSNDPLLVALCTFALVACLRANAAGWTWQRSALCGVLCGLALLTKTSALALVAFCAMAAAMGGWRKSPRSALGLAAVVVGVALLMSVPWMVRTYVRYGDPVGMRIFTAGFANSPKASMFIEGVGGPAYLFQWVGWWTLRSLFGVFSYAQLFLPQAIYVAGGVVAAAALAGSVRGHLAARDATRRSAAALCWLWFAIVLLAFLRFNMSYFQAQARYLLPALAPLAGGFALGWPRLFPIRFRGMAAWALLVALFALNVYALWLLGPAFAAIVRA